MDTLLETIGLGNNSKAANAAVPAANSANSKPMKNSAMNSMNAKPVAAANSANSANSAMPVKKAVANANAKPANNGTTLKAKSGDSLESVSARYNRMYMGGGKRKKVRKSKKSKKATKRSKRRGSRRGTRRQRK